MIKSEPTIKDADKKLTALLDDIIVQVGTAYRLARDLEKKQEPVDEVEEFALTLMDTYLKTDHKTDDANNKIYWRDRAMKMIAAGYGKVKK